jgi:DNA polymerase-1
MQTRGARPVRRLLLLDSDIVAYKLASATEEKFLFDGPGTEPAIHTSLEDTLRGVEKLVETYIETYHAAEVVVCLSDPVNNWRKNVYPAYKGNRKGRRPEFLMEAKAHLASLYPSYQRPGLEADDILGILSTSPVLWADYEKVIVSEDKDLRTIPGLLINPREDRESPRKISRVAAARFFYTQIITGDPTDNYPGARGVGEKSAEVLSLKTTARECDMWNIALSAYYRKGQTKDDAVTQARVARICQHTDYNYDTKEVILWNPPN